MDVLQYPMYFRAIDSGRVIEASDVYKDLRTLELATGYLKPAGISSALHVAVKVNGVLAGLVCLEQTAVIRRWHIDETRFAREIADQVEILLLAQERHMAQRKVESGFLFMNALMEAIPDPVFYKDIQGRFLGCNASFEKIMGVARADIIGRMSFEVWADEQARVLHMKDMDLIHRGGSQSYDALIRFVDGKKSWRRGL